MPGALHCYLPNFWTACNAGNLPAVSFLKAPGYQDGHAGYSDPLAEQTFLVNTINAIMQARYWASTAIVIAYDDSDGWYDHQMGPIVKQSNTSADALFDGACGVANATTDQSSILRFIEDNWGLGYIGNGSLDNVAGSLLNNFDFAPGRRAPRLILDPSTGEPVQQSNSH